MRYAQPPSYDGAGRLRSFPAVSSATLNPMMGHVRYAYASQVDEDLTLCARYDLNVYSYFSDLTLGAEYVLGAPSDEKLEASSMSLREQRGVWTTSNAALSLREHAPRPESECDGPRALPPSARHALPSDARQEAERPRAATHAAARPQDAVPTASAVAPLPPSQPSRPAAGSATPTLYGLLKVRMSASGLLALLWEGHWNHCLVSVGLQTQLTLRPTPSATSTLGAEIVYVEG